MHKQWHIITIYSLTHFLIDFACAFLMFHSIVKTPDFYLCILLYNFFSFAVQMPLGILADKWNRNYLFAIIGCILVAASYGFSFFYILAAVTLGIGNGLFHIGGGIDVLNMSEKKSGALGVFVSPGALGVYFGTMLGKGAAFSSIFILSFLLVATLFIFLMHKFQSRLYTENAELSLAGAFSPNVLMAIACFFIVVCIRSFVGLSLNFPWKSSGYWGVILIFAVVLGKIAGGFLMDRFGIRKTVYLSLGLSALLFLFSQISLLGVIAVFLFNMTMPITLWIMAKILKGAKGFAFGLLIFGLFLGFLPAYFGTSIISTTVFALLAFVSLILLFIGIKRVKI